MVANEVTDTTQLKLVHPALKILVDAKAQGSLINYRNDYRRDMDYSLLVTLVFWGLNIVDATVDAHLRDFDVSDELALRVKPVLLPGTFTPGISLVLNFK